MAESLLYGVSADDGSDALPEHLCDPCFESNGDIKPVEGYCIDCGENLCVGCFTYHLRPKPFRHHRLKNKSTTPPPIPKRQTLVADNTNLCPEHRGETIQSFCISHQKLCCKVCCTIHHKACDTELISKTAVNIKDSQKLKSIVKELVKLRKRYNEHLNKAGSHEILIQKNHTNAINDMMKLRQKFDKLMTETKIQADAAKEEDFEKIENVSTTCNTVIEQIDKTTSNLDSLKVKDDGQNLFISVHQAECQLQALEISLTQLDNANTVREYEFEPNDKLQTILKDLKILGKLRFSEATDKTIGSITNIAMSTQMKRIPVYEKDINVKTSFDKPFSMYGLAVLPNSQILITSFDNKKVRLINTQKNKIMSEIKLSGVPVGITTMTANEVAVTQNIPNTIQMLNISNNKLKSGRKIAVNGDCNGIAYNAKDQTFIVSFRNPSKVEIIDMTGTVIRSIQKDSKGVELFHSPFHVALGTDRSGVYVSDWNKQSCTFMTLSGQIKAVYKNSKFVGPMGICVDKSGIVYVVGRNSNTVHQIEPDSGEVKLLLEWRDGLSRPRAIGYCDVEDKLYVGLQDKHVVKVFKMELFM